MTPDNLNTPLDPRRLLKFRLQHSQRNDQSIGGFFSQISIIMMDQSHVYGGRGIDAIRNEVGLISKIEEAAVCTEYFVYVGCLLGADDLRSERQRVVVEVGVPAPDEERAKD